MVPDGDDAFVERLLSLADGSEDETAARLAGEDPDRTAATVLAEVVSRTKLFDGPAEAAVVQFDLRVGDTRLGYLVSLAEGGGKVEQGWLDDPWVLIRQDLADLVRAVFGPAGARHGSTREVLLKDEPGPASWTIDDPWTAQREAATRTAYQIVRACSGYSGDLDGLAVRFGSDKWGGHWYTPHYQRHFGPLRDQRLKILEIGIGGYHLPDAGGASLAMWKHYFRRGLVYGLDIFDKSGLAEPRLRPVKGSQSDAAFLDSLAREIGPLDIVVDDGSHLSSDILGSFTALFPHLRPGGIYVIEDLQTSYWPGWEGDSDELNNPATAMGFVKTLVDGLNHAERVHAEPYEPSATDRTITGIHLYHNIAFIEKGRNTEQAAPSWISRTTNPAQTWATMASFWEAHQQPDA